MEIPQVNCSEATCRIDISNLTQSQINDLEISIMKLMIDKEREEDKNINQLFNVNGKSLKKIRAEFSEESNSDTNIYFGTDFGKKIMRIKGGFPYNNGDDLTMLLDEKQNEEDLEIDYEYEEN